MPSARPPSIRTSRRRVPSVWLSTAVDGSSAGKIISSLKPSMVSLRTVLGSVPGLATAARPIQPHPERGEGTEEGAEERDEKGEEEDEEEDEEEEGEEVCESGESSGSWKVTAKASVKKRMVSSKVSGEHDICNSTRGGGVSPVAWILQDGTFFPL